MFDYPFKPKENKDEELEKAGKELQELTGIDYKEALSEMQKNKKNFWENQKK